MTNPAARVSVASTAYRLATNLVRFLLYLLLVSLVASALEWIIGTATGTLIGDPLEHLAGALYSIVELGALALPALLLFIIGVEFPFRLLQPNSTSGGNAT